MKLETFKEFLQNHLAQKYACKFEGDNLEFTLSDKAGKGAPLRIFASPDQEEVLIQVGNSNFTFDFFDMENEGPRRTSLEFVELVLSGDVEEKHRILFSSTRVGKHVGYDLDLTSWGRKKYAGYPVTSALAVTVDDIHQVLDCDGLSAREIEQEDDNAAYSEISKLIVRERNVSQEVADDFTRHYIDDENSHETADHFLAIFDDLLSHIANDKRP